MTEPVTGEGRTKGTKRIIGVAGEEPYRPHKRTEVERRSPYPFRSGVKCPEEGDDEVESEVRGEAEAGMAQGGEALGAAALLEYYGRRMPRIGRRGCRLSSYRRRLWSKNENDTGWRKKDS